MTKKELNEWYLLNNQYVNGWHLSDSDKISLIRLNYLLMELCHNIHNVNMLNKL